MAKLSVKSSTGKLYVTLPKGAAWDMTIYAAGSNKVLSSTMLKTSFNLLPGAYDLEINHIKVTGVPVVKGYQTRLKTGVLRIENATSWTLYDEFKKTVLINSLAAETRGLPVGKYKLAIMGQDRDIEIKDGGTMVGDDTPFETDDPMIPQITESANWVITPKNGIPEGKGQLSVKLPGPQTETLPNNESITIPDLTVCKVRFKLPNSDSYTPIQILPEHLVSGSYHVRLNNVSILNVPIREGKETRLKAGFLIIKHDGIFAWDLYYRDTDGVRFWVYKNEFDNWRKIALPPGEYTMYFETSPGPFLVYKIIIKDGETVTNGRKQ